MWVVNFHVKTVLQQVSDVGTVLPQQFVSIFCSVLPNWITSDNSIISSVCNISGALEEQ